MRLKKLKLKGVTSFKKEQVIDFESFLNDGQIFAITGPTGSGKSSLLSAIFLCLYGSPPKNIQRHELVALDSSQADIELDFSYQGKDYTAIWTCKTKGKSGQLKNPQTNRLLYCGGELLELLPEDIIGLSKDQFSKTIIINQGQFADFLTAKFNVRRSILEKIYQTEEISLISQTLRLDIKELNQQIQVLEGKISTGAVFSEEDFAIIVKECEKAKRQKENAQKYRDLIEITNKDLKEITQLEHQKNKDKEDIQALEQQIAQAQEEYLNAKAAWEKNKKICTTYQEKMFKLRPLLEDLTQNLQEQGHTAKSFTQTQEENNEQISRYEKIEKSIHEKKELENKIQKEFIKLELVKDNNSIKIESLDISQLKNTDILIQKLEQHQREIDFNHQRNLEKKEILEQIRTSGEELNKKVIKLQQQWSDEYDAQKYKEKLHDLSLEKEMNIRCIEEFQNLDQLKRENKQAIEEFKEKIGIGKKEADETFKIINKRKQEKEKLELKIENIELKNQLHLLYHKGQESHKCPVCLQDLNQENPHPNYPQNQVQQLSHELTAIDLELEKHQEKVHQLNAHSQHLQLSLQEMTKRTTLKEDTFFEKYTPHLNKYSIGINEEDLIKKLESIQQLLDQQIQDISKSQNEHQMAQYQLKEIQQRQEQLRASYQENSKQLKEIEEDEKSHSKTTAQLRSQLEKSLIQGLNILTLAPTTDTLAKQEIHQLIALKEKFDQNRLLLEHEIKAKNDTTQQLSIYQKRLEELLQNKEKLQKLVVDKKKEIIDISQCSNDEISRLIDIKKYRDKIEKEYQQLQSTEEKYKKDHFEKEMTKERILERLNLKKQKIEEASNLILQTLYTIQNHQIERILENLPQPEVFESSDFLNKHQQLVKSLKQLKSATFDQISSEQTLQLITFVKMEVFDTIIEDIQLKLTAYKDQELTLKTQIEAQKHKIKEQQENIEHLKNVSHQLTLKKNLYDVLGGDQFSRFAYSFIENQLLMWANKELKSLCHGRYEITTDTRHQASGPEFFVIDHWKNSVQRHVNTLSGGETFLVSLSLAMGLAELTRGQTEIETLIIDEGFGTLDSQSIDEVLEVLNSISRRGKTIGLISHVKEMTDRIPIKIGLQKDSQGHSQIMIEH